MNDKNCLRYSDFEYINDNSILQNNMVALFGAGEKGIRVMTMLEKFGIKVTCFLDNAKELHGIQIGGLMVYEPESLCNKNLFRSVDCIIACSDRACEMYEQLRNIISEDYDRSILFLTYWGVAYSLFVNHRDDLDLMFGEDAYAKKCSLLEVIWARQALGYLEGIITCDEHICIFQPGKVGSTSLNAMMKEIGIRCFQLHSLSFPKHILGNRYESIWKEAVSKARYKRLKIVCIVRNPILRDYSAFWEPFSVVMGKYIGIPFLSNDFQKMYDIYTKGIVDNNLLDICGSSHPFVWNDEFQWFDDEIKKYLGIDIYKHAFDREKGYCLIEEGNISIFLMKLEKMSELFPELESFLGGGIKLSMQKKYDADSKVYSMAYHFLHDKIKLRDWYLEHYFNNKKVDFFYTEEEKRSFLL